MSKKQRREHERPEVSIVASLRHNRIAAKMTLDELSHITGLDIPTLSRIENGKRRLTVRNLLLISKALKVDAKRLLNQPRARAVRVKA